LTKDRPAAAAGTVAFINQPLSFLQELELHNHETIQSAIPKKWNLEQDLLSLGLCIANFL